MKFGLFDLVGVVGVCTVGAALTDGWEGAAVAGAVTVGILLMGAAMARRFECTQAPR